MDTDYDDIEPPLTISTDEVRTRKEGDNGLFIKLVPKFFYNVILFVGLTSLRAF